MAAAPTDWERGRDLLGPLQLGRVRTLVDVGANEGQFLFPALAYLQPERVLAIEMLPDLAAKLASEVPPGCTVVNVAVGRTVGQSTVFRSRYSPASSLLPILPEANSYYGIDLAQEPCGIVPMMPLDAICSEAGIGEIDLLKADIQGYEIEMIRGGGEVLARTKQIIAEVNFAHIYERGPLYDELIREFEAAGFFLADIFSLHRSTPDGRLIHGDVLLRSAKYY